MSLSAPPAVELVVNTFERTYRNVLAPGVFPAIERQNAFQFHRRVALVNNVLDRADAERRAQALVDAGELHAFAFVADELERALTATGLSHQDLQPSPHFTDCALVAVTLEGAPWLVYWDADIALDPPVDWITPSLALMAHDPRVLAANPSWGDRESLERETLALSGDFAIGQGFSDQVFVARRSDLARPIYGQRCVCRLRYPEASRGGYEFEARVDAYMRHHGRLRATYLKAAYRHPAAAAATHARSGAANRIRAARNALILRAVRASPVKRDCWRGI